MMDGYLSQIAARNTVQDQSALLPVVYANTSEDPDPFEPQTVDELHHGAVLPGNSLAEQTGLLPQQEARGLPSHAAQGMNGLTNNKLSETNYITRYIERLAFTENPSPFYPPGPVKEGILQEPFPIAGSNEQPAPVSAKDNLWYTEQVPAPLAGEVQHMPVSTPRRDKPGQEMVMGEYKQSREYTQPQNNIPHPLSLPPRVDPLIKQDVVHIPVQNSTAGDNGKAGKTQKNSPVNTSLQVFPPRHAEVRQETRGYGKQGGNEPVAGKLDPGKLEPFQPPLVSAKPANNKAAPKLVIGRITVEVLQPAKPAPVKVVNHIRQVSSATTGSNTNKLSFGLGQL